MTQSTQSTQYTDLQDFLKSHKTTDKAKITHTRIGNKDKNIYGGSYHILTEDKKQFYMLYSKWLMLGRYEYLTEVQPELGCCVVDLDFNYSTEITTRQHTQEQIEDIVNAYVDTIKKLFIVDKDYTVYVLQKPSVNCVKDKTKDGIHLFITLRCTKEQQQMIRKHVQDEIKQILKPLPLINKWDAVIDDGVAKRQANWMMLGSRKPDNECYEITNKFEIVYDADNDECEIEEAIFKKTTKEVIYRALCLKLSVQNERYEILETKEQFVEEEKQFKQKTLSNTSISNDVEVDEFEQQTNNSKFWDYVSCIPKTEFVEYNKWFRFMCLHKNLVGYDDYETLDKFLQSVEGYDEFNNFEIYDTNINITEPRYQARWTSLKSWAFEHNPKLKEEIDEKYYTQENEFNRFTCLNISNSYIEKEIEEISKIIPETIDDEMKQKEYIQNKAIEIFNYVYKKQKKYFDKFHVKILSPSCFINITNNEISYLTLKALKDNYQNQPIIPSKYNTLCDFNKFVKNNNNFINMWLKDINIPTYNNSDFIPPPVKCPKNTFNMFNGLEIEDIKPIYDEDTDIDIFLNHMKILVNHDKKGYEYLLRYLAHSVQSPAEIPRVALVFTSEEGVGKNIFFELFAEKIYGRNRLLQTADMEQVVGRWSLISQRFMVIMDETQSKDSFSNSEKVKNIITSRYVQLERKGIDAIPIKNTGRYIFFSNNETPVKIGLTDRRFVVYECSNERQFDNKYFTELVNAFSDSNRVRKMYDYLMNLDLSEFNPTTDRPITDAYKDIQSVNIPTMARYLTDLYHQYQTIKEEMNEAQTDSEIESKTNELISYEGMFGNSLYHTYLQYCRENNIKFNMTSHQFGRNVSKYGGISKTRKTKGVIYNINYDELFKYLNQKNLIENN